MQPLHVVFSIKVYDARRKNAPQKIAAVNDSRRAGRAEQSVPGKPRPHEAAACPRKRATPASPHQNTASKGPSTCAHSRPRISSDSLTKNAS